MATFPIVSVWRVSGEVLRQLPEVAAATDVDDTRHRLALADPDFVLAERRYDGVTADEVEAALRADGFGGIAGPRPSEGVTWSKDCCGEYDAVWVTVVDAAEGATAVVSVVDADVRATAPTIIALGSLLAVVGAVLLIGGARPGSRPAERAGRRQIADGEAETGRDTMPL